MYEDNDQTTSQQSYQQTLEDQRVIIDREDQFLQIESDIMDINEIMRDLANLTNAQGNAVGNDTTFCFKIRFLLPKCSSLHN